MSLRRDLSAIVALAACPLAAGAQSFDGQDWQLVCDNTRTCRAAGYSTEGSDHPVSVLFTRAAGQGSAILGELQLGTHGAASVHPSSVVLALPGKSVATIRVDRDNHAMLTPAATAALLKALVAGNDARFTSGKSTWAVSARGAAEALQKMDEAQGRTGRPSAIVRPGGASDADVASAMARPRFEAAGLSAAAQAGDDALVVRVLSSIQSNAQCPLLDDGASQAKGRLWHLDANRLLVSQPCRAAAHDSGNGYWIANLRAPYDARAITFSGGDVDGTGSITAREPGLIPGDCVPVKAWTWNGYRFEQTYDATGGLCRGVKEGGAWQLPSVVTDVIPAH